MTDKKADIHLKQLTDALIILAADLEGIAKEATRYTAGKVDFDRGLNAGRYGSFTQSSTAIQFILDRVGTLPPNASPEDIKDLTTSALRDAGDVWD